jgi:hypothetical protein
MTAPCPICRRPISNTEETLRHYSGNHGGPSWWTRLIAHLRERVA